MIFDEEFVTVRGDIPSKPKQRDYDDTLDGMIQYDYELNDWYNIIASYIDRFECPVGTYSVKSNDLFIGLLNMGAIKFTSNNEFTLDYTKSLSDQGDLYLHQNLLPDVIIFTRKHLIFFNNFFK